MVFVFIANCGWENFDKISNVKQINWMRGRSTRSCHSWKKKSKMVKLCECEIIYSIVSRLNIDSFWEWNIIIRLWIVIWWIAMFLECEKGCFTLFYSKLGFWIRPLYGGKWRVHQKSENRVSKTSQITRKKIEVRFWSKKEFDEIVRKMKTIVWKHRQRRTRRVGWHDHFRFESSINKCLEFSSSTWLWKRITPSDRVHCGSIAFT